MRFCTFASSSAGNASLLSCGDTHILIDAGISCRRIVSSLKELGLGIDDLSAIFITHSHGDHIGGLTTLLKHHAPAIHCSEECARQLSYRIAGIDRCLYPFALGSSVTVNDCRITSIPTSHDASGSTGYHVAWQDLRFGYLTDTGILPAGAKQLLGVDLLFLEANHDVETLLSGPYPYHLKDRVLGPYGHLSNDTAAFFACDAAHFGTRNIILAHLSKENNTPQMALNAVGRALEAKGYDGRLTVAPREKMTITYIEKAGTSI
ncbi:MAG: MBL fold metallo-hydrolase [Ruminococcaceae bacterium]|nr:MBL fold metallo-hydrolase [Oscillospiraceae bacterium]